MTSGDEPVHRTILKANRVDARGRRSLHHPGDNDVRIQLTRGADYAPPVESTAKGQLAFTC